MRTNPQKELRESNERLNKLRKAIKDDEKNQEWAIVVMGLALMIGILAQFIKC